jgi:hypothetical protein
MAIRPYWDAPTIEMRLDNLPLASHNTPIQFNCLVTTNGQPFAVPVLA